MSNEKKPAHEIVAEHIVKLTEENATLRAELDRLRGKGEPVVLVHHIGIGGTVHGTLRKGADAASITGAFLYTHPAPQDDARDATDYRALYLDLVTQVVNAVPGVSLHNRAKQIIAAQENQNNAPAKAADAAILAAKEKGQ